MEGIRLRICEELYKRNQILDERLNKILAQRDGFYISQKEFDTYQSLFLSKDSEARNLGRFLLEESKFFKIHRYDLISTKWTFSEHRTRTLKFKLEDFIRKDESSIFWVESLFRKDIIKYLSNFIV